MNMPDGTDVSRTESKALEISRWLGDKTQNPEIASNIVYIGDGGPRFYLTLTPVAPDPGMDRGTGRRRSVDRNRCARDATSQSHPDHAG